MKTELNHIVIVSSVLEEGVDFCEKTFGVRLIKGGEHVRVGTHNYSLKLEGVSGPSALSRRTLGNAERNH